MPTTNLDNSLNIRTKGGVRPQFLIDGEPITGDAIQTKLIQSEADLPDLVGGRHPLDPFTVYQIDGLVFLLNGIDFGNGSTIWSTGVVPNALIYLGSGTMFQARDANYVVSQVGINCGAGTLIDAEDVAAPTTTIGVFINVLFTAINIGGTFKNVDSFRFFQCQWNEITTDGFTIVGAINQIAGDVFGTGASGELKAGTFLDLGSATFNFLEFTTYDFNIAAGATFISGLVDSGNVNAGGQALVGPGRTAGAGTDLVNIDSDDLLWRFDGWNRQPDTQEDAMSSLTANALETAIVTQGVGVLVNGVWVVNRASFFGSTTAGRATYLGAKDLTTPIDVTAGLLAASGTFDALVSVAINGVVVADGVAVAVNANKPVSATVIWQARISTNDFVEVFATNLDGTVNIVVESCRLRIR